MRIYAFDFARLILVGLLLTLASSPMRRNVPPLSHTVRECIAIGGMLMGCRSPVYKPDGGRLGLPRRYYLRDSD